MGRTIAIGDVHGCAWEFEKLLKKIKPEPTDTIIQLGDLINKGPNSHDAIAIAQDCHISAVMGNHELRLLKAKKDHKGKALTSYNRDTYEQLTKKDWKWIKQLPKYIHKKPLKSVFVHGGFLPDSPWRSQPIEVVSQVQVIDKKGNPRKRSDAPSGKLWVNLWKKKPFVIYGHIPRRKVYRTKKTIGIDTGCVYGGNLSAYILEEDRIVRVAAKKAYC